MITSTNLYLFFTISSILTLSKILFSIFICSSGLFLVFYLMSCSDDKYNEKSKITMMYFKYLKISTISTILSCFLIIFIPTKQEFAMIYIIPKIANSETLSKISQEIPDIVKLSIDGLKSILNSVDKTESK